MTDITKQLKKTKYVLSVLLAVFLLFIAWHFFLSEQHKAFLRGISFTKHIISAAFLALSYLVAGLQLRYVYKKTANIRLSSYDTVFMPYVINIWGYIIPLQGSFLYAMAYLKVKYNMQLKAAAYIYVFIFLASTAFFGLVAACILPFTPLFSTTVFCVLLLMASMPLWLYLVKKILDLFHFQNIFLQKIKRILQDVFSGIQIFFKDYKLCLYLICYNFLLTIINTAWAFWICVSFGFDIPFFALLMIGFVMKITMLFKITPGNQGLIQLANGGIFALFALDPSSGIFISLFKTITLFLFSFPIGIIGSIINLKHFSANNIKNLFKQKKNIERSD